MKVEYYITADGKKPLTKWLDRLKDAKAKAAIIQRIFRLTVDLFGDVKPVGEGVSELRVDVGKGYRVYYARSGNEIVLLLCGGDRKTQDADIKTAKEYWNDYKNRKKDRHKGER